MMKKILLGTAALIALGAPAMAADLGARTYTKAPAYAPAPVYTWTGFYVGGHIGGDFAGNTTLGAGASRSDSGAFLGGIQGGYDYQFAPNWVLGIEAQYSWLSQKNTVAVGGVGTFSDNLKGLGSVTGRIGYTWGPALVYAKGGYAFTDYSVGWTGAGAINAKKDGYTVGGGLEYLFAPNWSAKAEYQYYNFGNVDFGTYSFKHDEHTVKAGLNYRFNWGGPVVAKY